MVGDSIVGEELGGSTSSSSVSESFLFDLVDFEDFARLEAEAELLLLLLEISPPRPTEVGGVSRGNEREAWFVEAGDAPELEAGEKAEEEVAAFLLVEEDALELELELELEGVGLEAEEEGPWTLEKNPKRVFCLFGPLLSLLLFAFGAIFLDLNDGDGREEGME